MFDIIINKVIEMLKKSIQRQAKEKGVTPSSVAICINTNDELSATPSYRYLIKGQEQPYMTFKQMIGVKGFDIQGREMYVAPFLQKSLAYITIKENIDLKSINLIFFLKESNNHEQEEDQILFYLYNGKHLVKELNIDYIMQGITEFAEMVSNTKE